MVSIKSLFVAATVLSLSSPSLATPPGTPQNNLQCGGVTCVSGGAWPYWGESMYSGTAFARVDCLPGETMETTTNFSFTVTSCCYSGRGCVFDHGWECDGATAPDDSGLCPEFDV
ncbi:hypothetical protein MNV49_001377 [Pseudohyphozyma bogoriensis]|nr:hypothetical protein MNV49_001377 [Pseudohyphozyma bogoriensis]